MLFMRSLCLRWPMLYAHPSLTSIKTGTFSWILPHSGARLVRKLQTRPLWAVLTLKTCGKASISLIDMTKSKGVGRGSHPRILDRALTRAEIARRYKQRHPEKVRARLNAWRRRNPEKVKVMQQHGHRMSEYGMSRSEFDARMLAQNNCCSLCGTAFSSAPLTVDHDHITGEIRSLLCQKCNSMLGLSGDNPAVLRRAAEYLERPKRMCSEVLDCYPGCTPYSCQAWRP